MNKCPTVVGKQRSFVEEYLIRNAIYDLSDITGYTKQQYRMFVSNCPNLSDNQKKVYSNTLEPFIMYHLVDDYPEIRNGIINNTSMERCMRNKIGLYLMEQGVRSVENITPDVRTGFEAYLRSTISERKAAEYVKGLDKIKLESIRHENESKPFVQHKLKAVSEKVFLGYHPDYAIAMSLYYCQDKSKLLYDFTKVSETVSLQIIAFLNWVFENQKKAKLRHDIYLLPLHRLFDYIINNSITDIELMDAKEILGYRESVSGKVGTKDTEYFQIVYMIQNFLFCHDKKTRWEASSWFLNRFDALKKKRMNPANMINRISFWEIENIENRQFLKDYMRYEISLSDKAVQRIRDNFYNIKSFLQFCDEHSYFVKNINKDILDDYAGYLNLLDIAAQTYNKRINVVFQFWDFLVVEKV
ncbi:MAG: hypothetical protein K6G24_13670, partial [Lachnospiraceae bacterium]|nr:hypothetical protein [Lachnospiraceae bacterium]